MRLTFHSKRCFSTATFRSQLRSLFSTHSEHDDLLRKAFTEQVNLIDGRQGPSTYWAENADWVVDKLSTLPLVGHRLGSKSIPSSIPDLTVLEVASGTGMISRRIAKKFSNAKVNAVDFTQAMLVRNQQLAKEEGLSDRIQSKLGSVYELPYPNESFDIVIGRWFLHHLLDIPSAIEEIYRVVRKGGFFVNIDVAPPEDKTVANRMDEIEKLRDPSHVAFPSRTYLDSILTNLNFTIIQRDQAMDRREVEKWANMARTTQKSKEKILAAFENELTSPGNPKFISGFEPFRDPATSNVCFTFQCVYTAAQKLHHEKELIKEKKKE